MNNNEILIAGAGPSGLSMALFLSELGYKPHIIDKKKIISPHSKALAVNPKTLQILEPYGITNQLLEKGRKMSALNIWQKDTHIYKNELNKVNHRYPFMLILPQKVTEETLVEALQQRNIDIAYQTELQSIKSDSLGHEVVLQSTDQKHNSRYHTLIGADGGQSIVRQKLGIQLRGFNYDQSWELYDIELDTSLAPDEGHIRLFAEGGMIMIRLEKNIWRVAGNLTDILTYLPKGTKTYDVIWQSNFRIHHKVAHQLNVINSAIIGDAAHQHSPVGARGMNLGIEDAYILSKLISQNRLSEYSAMRKSYVTNTVNRINNITTGVSGDTFGSRLFRNNLRKISILFPLVMPRARQFIMGLN